MMDGGLLQMQNGSKQISQNSTLVKLTQIVKLLTHAVWITPILTIEDVLQRLNQKKKKTIFPMKAFTPKCMEDPKPTEKPTGPPKSGKDDLAKKDLAKAADDLTSFAKT